MTSREHQLQADFENNVLRGYAPSTRQRYIRCVERILDYFKNRKSLADIYPRDREAYRKSREAEGVKPRTVDMELTAASTFWAWLMTHPDSGVHYNPFRSQDTRFQ